MKNKITSKLLLILVFALFVGMALGSGSKDEDSGKKEIVDSEESEEDTEAEEEDKASEPEAEEAEGEMEAVTVEEQVLVEQDGIKITATEMTEDSFWGQGVMLLIENDSDKNISVGCKALMII